MSCYLIFIQWKSGLFQSCKLFSNYAAFSFVIASLLVDSSSLREWIHFQKLLCYFMLLLRKLRDILIYICPILRLFFQSVRIFFRPFSIRPRFDLFCFRLKVLSHARICIFGILIDDNLLHRAWDCEPPIPCSFFVVFFVCFPFHSIL